MNAHAAREVEAFENRDPTLQMLKMLKRTNRTGVRNVQYSLREKARCPQAYTQTNSA
jgi:hypothetical protein